ncbi:unnamed protein product [Ambrosiozyma monospora]|uniref:Unnamed protein product n=1 Tax=Ambrosiozyma monospora TaxID=43982 RepID=A0A9W7DEA7_AMBMO|nr:unnamed protein product [Ambrosiozyma monospora]
MSETTVTPTTITIPDSIPKSATSSLQALLASASISASPTNSSSSKFIASKPSTVLFFIALCVGVIIACLFLFFTVRYLVRSKYGLYLPPPHYHRSPFYIGPTGRASMNGAMPYFENDITMNFMLAAPPPAHQRRNHFSRKRKLTQEEVDDLFPLKTYSKWLNGGKEEVINRNDGKLVYEEQLDTNTSNNNDENENGNGITNNNTNTQTNDNHDNDNDNDTVNANNTTIGVASSTAGKRKSSLLEEVDLADVSTEKTTVNNTTNNNATITESKKEGSSSDANNNNDNGITIQKSSGTSTFHQENVNEEEDNDDNDKTSDVEDPHFTSGTCAICLDNLDDDDEVRGLICGHVFHADCVDPWLTNRRGCCPMCKRDYYLMNHGNRPSNYSPGERDLDSIFNLGDDTVATMDLYFPRPTKFKALTLLACQIKINNGEYPLSAQEIEQQQQDFNRNSVDYAQALLHDSFNDGPPVPKMDELNPTINYILSETPFHPDDLANLDQLAYQSANSMHRWYLKPLWRLMGVSKFDLYYHYVIWFYERQRFRRTSDNEGGDHENNADGTTTSNSNTNSGSVSRSRRRHQDDEDNTRSNNNENENETRDRNQALNILV